MEIKELSLIENLSQEGQEISAIDSVVGGHGDYRHGYYGHDYGYCPHPFFKKVVKPEKISVEKIADAVVISYAAYFGPGVGYFGPDVGRP